MANDNLEMMARLERARMKTTASMTTPCQVTGEPGIPVVVAGGSFPAQLSPDIMDKFDARLQKTPEFQASVKLEKERILFQQQTPAESALGNEDVCLNWINLVENGARARAALGRTALFILGQLKEEFGGDSKVSSSTIII